MSSELTEEHLYEEYLSEEYLDESFDENYVNLNYVKIPDWHMAIIEERMARYESERTEWTPWEEFEKELFAEIEGGLKD
ncbi:MAG TPA: addiction module protein [Pyrinomonadaceae bacterium]|nr:addiction module protein [Pyrinomonadaceae bacterium]